MVAEMDAEAHYYERLRQFAAEEVAPGGIVLLGSSHLEWFNTARFLPGRRFVNRGIAGDRLGLAEHRRDAGATGVGHGGPALQQRGILHRLDVSVFACNPAFILFENGINDLGELWRTGTPTLAEIVDAYERVVAAIRTRLPAVPLLIVNILPTSGAYAGLNPLVRQLNPHVARTAEQHGCAHMNFHADVVSPAGELRAELTDDGLHLNEPGYALWTEKLTPFLPPAPVAK
jgi:lysophospholipase L1-like esterase